MAASILGLMALLCLLGAILSVWIAVRDCDFLDVLEDDVYMTSPPPKPGWMAMGFAFLLGIVVFGVLAVLKAT